MGKDLYEKFPQARDLFERGNDFLGRRITDTMFYGSEEDLMMTINTQPAVFLYEVVLAKCQSTVSPDVVAGHSLGEFAALVVNGTITFEDGLNLVLNRAVIGQRACEKVKTGMGAVSSDIPSIIASFSDEKEKILVDTRNFTETILKLPDTESAEVKICLEKNNAEVSPLRIQNGSFTAFLAPKVIR